MESFWDKVNDAMLRQGDYLPGCLVPVFYPYLRVQKPQGTPEVRVKEYNLIVITQSCDLANKKVQFVSLCPIWLIENFQETSPSFKKKGTWENVRKGRVEGLHLLASPDTPADNKQALVVDFREIYSLPVEHAKQRAQEIPNRLKLRSPYLEHFSQAFARFFMRVGLPSSIPQYT